MNAATGELGAAISASSFLSTGKKDSLFLLVVLVFQINVYIQLLCSYFSMFSYIQASTLGPPVWDTKGDSFHSVQNYSSRFLMFYT